VLLVIGTTKFLHGAWVVVLLIPALVLLFRQIRGHYDFAAKSLTRLKDAPPVRPKELRHTAILPVSGIHHGVINALNYGLSISKDVRAVYVELNPEATEALKKEWDSAVPNVPLVVLKSPYRSVIAPIVRYIYRVEKEMEDDVVTVIIPEFVTTKWYHQLLHNQTAILLNLALRGRREIIVTSVRYHLENH
jgi:hypothetical protein